MMSSNTAKFVVRVVLGAASLAVHIAIVDDPGPWPLWAVNLIAILGVVFLVQAAEQVLGAIAGRGRT